MTLFRIARPRFLAYFAFEGGLIFAVVYGLAVLTTHLAPTVIGSGSAASILATAAVFSCVLLLTQGSHLGDQGSLRRELVLFGVACCVLGLLSYAGVWVLFGSHKRLSSLLLLESAVAVPLAVSVWRWISVRLNVLNPTRETVLIVGSGQSAQQVCRWICENHSREYAVLGFAHEDDSRMGQVLTMGARIQTDYGSLSRFAIGRADRLLVAVEEKRGKLPLRQLMELRLRGVEIEEATSFFERISGKIAVETMLPSWLIFSEGFKTSALRSVLKRCADVMLSTTLLLLASPLMLLTAILIKLDSRGPVLFRQARLGLGEREFNMLKFRSMCVDAEGRLGPTWAQEFDPRVTRVGRVIRFMRVDELPQLFNILTGKMSFVGPRPERGHFVRQLEEAIPYYGLRMTVRPGLTGWAQVEYGYTATDEDALEKLKYDLYYIKNNDLLLDLWIVLKTVGVVIRGSGAR